MPKRWYQPDWLTLFSCVLYTLAFPPYDMTFLAWIALVPWLLALDRCKSLRASIAQGVWLSFVISIIGFHWIAYVLQENGGLPLVASWIGLCLFGLICQPQFYFYAFFHYLGRKHLKSGLPLATFVLALLYTGLDWALPKLFADTLGHAFYRYSNLRQAAEFGGAPLLTFLALSMNLNVFFAFLTASGHGLFKRSSIKTVFTYLSLPILMVALASGFGIIRKKRVQERTAQATDKVQIAVIQGNIGDFEKVAAERGFAGARHQVISTFTRLSDQALGMTPRPQALVWPETAYPTTFRSPTVMADAAMDRAVENYVKSRGIPLYFGGYDQDTRKDYNAFFFLSPHPEPGLEGPGDLQVYHKNILLLFGEYIPWMDQIPFLKSTFPQVANFGRGSGPEALDLPLVGGSRKTIRVGPAICYEVLYPDYILESARKGAQLLLNITNDSWFGPYSEPYLHLALSVFRSVETRLPLLRSTNTGFSALILPDGEIARRTPLNVETVMNVTVPLWKPDPTLLMSWGNWFGPFAAILGFMAWLIGILKDARPKGKARRLAKVKRPAHLTSSAKR